MFMFWFPIYITPVWNLYIIYSVSILFLPKLVPILISQHLHSSEQLRNQLLVVIVRFHFSHPKSWLNTMEQAVWEVESPILQFDGFFSERK